MNLLENFQNTVLTKSFLRSQKSIFFRPLLDIFSVFPLSVPTIIVAVIFGLIILSYALYSTLQSFNTVPMTAGVVQKLMS